MKIKGQLTGWITLAHVVENVAAVLCSAETSNCTDRQSTDKLDRWNGKDLIDGSLCLIQSEQR